MSEMLKFLFDIFSDCGVIVRNVGSRDNGDWLCQLHSRNGDIFQNATDIVPLYAGQISAFG